jgi:hypothetical protein
MRKQIRQGDVLFVRVDRVPQGAKLEDTKTVAYGEVTGHHHTMVELDTKSKAEVYTLEDQMFAKVLGDVVITHQEHDHLPVAEGIYEIRIQQEYTPEDIRRVLD